MKIDRKKLYAVISGDIVASSSLAPRHRERLHTVMKEASKEIRCVFKRSVPMDVDIFGGDSWQMLIADPGRSLRIGLFYRAYIKAHMETSKLDTRMVIAIGKVNFVPGRRVSEGDGEAFRASGSLLEEMTKSHHMLFSYPKHKESENLDMIIRLLDAIVRRRWTEKRSLAMLGALQGWSQEKIAELWSPPIKQPSIVDHLRGADWEIVEEALSFFEKRIPG